jgi:hypothetical protein
MPMATNPQISVGQHKLTTDMLASAMSGLTLPPNWWGYGMPPELTPGTSQITDMRGKTPMTSAPPNVPVNQSPRYTTTTTARPHTGNPQDSMFQMPNASAESMLMQQRSMAQSGYVNSMMVPNYQSSAAPMPMNANNGWLGQQVFPQSPQ